jgi:IS605 OrfB family transposase
MENIMIRTEQIRIKKYKALSEQCHIAKNLYNEGNYIVRQEFIKTTEEKEQGLRDKANWIRYGELDKLLQNSENYRKLTAATSQQILGLLDNNWKSFFQSIKEYMKFPDKFKGQPGLPKYKAKNGEFVLIYTCQWYKIKNGFIKFPKKTGLKKIKTRLDDCTNLKEVRIIPKGTDYICEIVYDKKEAKKDLDKSKVVSIDLGSTNIITIVNNIGVIPIVIKDNGKGIKSINQFFNKRNAELRSIYDLQKIKYGKKMNRLCDKHNRKKLDYIHKLTRFIINYCIENKIGKLIIGYNPDWKQKINIGKINNQNFVNIPYSMIINQLKYKGEEIGLEVIEQEESYTSKCSFLDNEEIKHQENYLGKRIKRGLFRSQNNIIINSDVNGAYNIGRKSNLKEFAFANSDRVGGYGLYPISIFLESTNKQNLLKSVNVF